MLRGAAVGQVTKESIYEHLRAFEEIANRPENEGSRATFLGYNASVDYVVAQLSSNTDYEITVQSLPVSLPVYTAAPTLSLTAPVAATFELNTDFLGFNYGGSGDVTAATQVRGAGARRAGDAPPLNRTAPSIRCARAATPSWCARAARRPTLPTSSRAASPSSTAARTARRA